jgi:hypothetical protein
MHFVLKFYLRGRFFVHITSVILSKISILTMNLLVFILIPYFVYLKPKLKCSKDRKKRCCELGSLLCNYEERKICSCIGGPERLRMENEKSKGEDILISMVPDQLCDKCCAEDSREGEECGKDDRDDCGCPKVRNPTVNVMTQFGIFFYKT